MKSPRRDCADGGTGIPCSPSVNPGSCLTGRVTEEIGAFGSGASSSLIKGLFIASHRFEKKKGAVGWRIYRPRRGCWKPICGFLFKERAHWRQKSTLRLVIPAACLGSVGFTEALQGH